MKNLITIAVLVVIGIFAYNHFNQPVTEDEQYLNDIRSDFREASKLMTQAERAGAAAGVDTTGSFEEGIERMKALRTELSEYIEELKDEGIAGKAIELKREIEAFLDDRGVTY